MEIWDFLVLNFEKLLTIFFYALVNRINWYVCWYKVMVTHTVMNFFFPLGFISQKGVLLRLSTVHWRYEYNYRYQQVIRCYPLIHLILKCGASRVLILKQSRCILKKAIGLIGGKKRKWTTHFKGCEFLLFLFTLYPTYRWLDTEMLNLNWGQK